MGDRFDRTRRHRRFGLAVPPPPLLRWGLEPGGIEPPAIGHNGGPPIEDEAPGYLWRRHCWTKAHREVWKNPGMGVMKFRAARAEAAGVTYHEYMLHLLDTGRYLQKEDVLKQTAASGPVAHKTDPG